MTETGPVAARVLLGRELAELRNAADLKPGPVAETLGWDASKLYRVEQGQNTLKATEVDELLRLYKADKTTAERIKVIAADARKRGSYGKVADWSRHYYGLEQDATELAFHQDVLVPGLFQTKDYARALIGTSKTMAPSDVDQAVETRIKRQSLLHRTKPPAVHLVLGEAALHQQVGGPAVLAEQLDHLAQLARLPHITVQLFPFSGGAHASLGQGFILLTLEIGGEPTRWVYLSDLTRGECRSDQARVRVYQLTFDSLVADALGEAETIARLEQARDGLR
ncbi:helix-turn-helix domain-containing protein [Amycolatopsis nigrescens]|uniref:helix-turn-helix domain-containing protein n=1 Tax=Amycolatopsis nigrescens TaxID=381445 RepID=UPI0003A811A6|nr:helix-turn-helix transcriptional regulator [Amycolatopsis nigrescens]